MLHRSPFAKFYADAPRMVRKRESMRVRNAK
jgi:hypothetical protein